MKLAVRDSQSVSSFRRRQTISHHQWAFLCHVHLLSIVLVLVNSGDEDPSTKQQQKPPQQQQVASFSSPSTSNPVSDEEGIDNFTLSNDNKELTTKSVESENSHDLPASEQHDAELMNNGMSRHDNISFKQKTSEGNSTTDATKNSFIDEPDIRC